MVLFLTVTVGIYTEKQLKCGVFGFVFKIYLIKISDTKQPSTGSLHTWWRWPGPEPAEAKSFIPVLDVSGRAPTCEPSSTASSSGELGQKWGSQDTLVPITDGHFRPAMSQHQPPHVVLYVNLNFILSLHFLHFFSLLIYANSI